MPGNRFRRLAGDEALPGPAEAASDRRERFGRLEIGEAASPPLASPSARAPADRALCPQCGQFTARDREHCWACQREIPASSQTPPAPPPEELTLVLDGRTYSSLDPELPPDIRVLLDQIATLGYSDKLITDWRNWRTTRNRGRPDVQDGVEEPVLRLDGKVYRARDKRLPPALKAVFRHIERHGVSPSLLEYLRRNAAKVTFRPTNTAAPTGDDLAFWREVQQVLADEKRAEAAAAPLGRTWAVIRRAIAVFWRA